MSSKSSCVLRTKFVTQGAECGAELRLRVGVGRDREIGIGIGWIVGNLIVLKTIPIPKA
jgi:hypothetical protein